MPQLLVFDSTFFHMAYVTDFSRTLPVFYGTCRPLFSGFFSRGNRISFLLHHRLRYQSPLLRPSRSRCQHVLYRAQAESTCHLPRYRKKFGWQINSIIYISALTVCAAFFFAIYLMLRKKILRKIPKEKGAIKKALFLPFTQKIFRMKPNAQFLYRPLFDSRNIRSGNPEHLCHFPLRQRYSAL